MLGLWCAASTPAGWLPLWRAASLRQHVELQTVRVRVKEAVCVCEYVCVRERKREKRGRGRVWIKARSEGGSKCEKDREKGQTERDGKSFLSR